MKPATMKPARYMCVSSCQRFELNSARQRLDVLAFPSTIGSRSGGSSSR